MTLDPASPACRHCRHCGRRGRYYRDEPTGYLAWHEWAERMSRTHHQEQCPGCGRLSVWKPGRTVTVEERRAREKKKAEQHRLLRDPDGPVSFHERERFHERR